MLVVAHRTPPTRAECERLVAAGVRIFEADVQIDLRGGRSPGRIVVSHYLPMGRRVQRDNWRLRWHLSADRDPELSDVAALVPEDCQIVLDVKERTADRRAALLAALIAAELDPARFLVCAGHPDDLATLRAAGLPTWRSVGRAAQLDDLLAGGRTADEAASVRHTLLTESTVARLHERVRSVVAWTVNRPARAASLRGIGVDGITTDRATVIRAMAARPN